MKRDKLHILVASVAVIILAVLLTGWSQQVVSIPNFGALDGEYYDPAIGNLVNPLYGWQQRSGTFTIQSVHCALAGPPAITAAGWPFPDVFTAQPLCSGAMYATVAPYAFAANFAVYAALLFIIFALSAAIASRYIRIWSRRLQS